MMFAKDINDHADHINHTRVKAHEMLQLIKHQPDMKNPLVPYDVVEFNRNFNRGFATQVATLQGRRQFSCAIPLHHIFGFCRNVRKVIY